MEYTDESLLAILPWRFVPLSLKLSMPREMLSPRCVSPFLIDDVASDALIGIRALKLLRELPLS